MPFIKITYVSPNNVSVQGAEYFEVEPDRLDGRGEVPAYLIDEVWQDAVNDFMSDTYAEIVENEGD